MTLGGAVGAPVFGLIAASAAGAHDGREAIAAVGGIARELAADAAAPDPGARALLVEAEGAAPALLDTLLARAAAWAAAGGAVVMAFARDQIDPVAAAMLGARGELLCAPSIAERVGALTLAAAAGMAGTRGGRLREEGPESEAERLKRLNSEVARIADALARLSRESGTGRLADRQLGFRGEPAQATRPADARAVRGLIRARRLRDQYFGGGLFEDPAWDMLLDLFAATMERQRVSVSSLCIASAVAPTTALRWITRMHEMGLFEREPDPADRRRVYIALSPATERAMHRYWSAAVPLAAGSD